MPIGRGRSLAALPSHTTLHTLGDEVADYMVNILIQPAVSPAVSYRGVPYWQRQCSKPEGQCSPQPVG
jgi:hypothetical protein